MVMGSHVCHAAGDQQETLTESHMRSLHPFPTFSSRTSSQRAIEAPLEQEQHHLQMLCVQAASQACILMGFALRILPWPLCLMWPTDRVLVACHHPKPQG